MGVTQNLCSLDEVHDYDRQRQGKQPKEIPGLALLDPYPLPCQEFNKHAESQHVRVYEH
jgi:hypothetical protein